MAGNSESVVKFTVDLSTQIKMTIRKTAKCPAYLLFETKRGGRNTRKICLFPAVWWSLRQIHTEIMIRLQEEISEDFSNRLDDRTVLNIKSYNNQKYICFIALDDNDNVVKKFSFNITQEEYEQLMNHSSEIDQCVRELENEQELGEKPQSGSNHKENISDEPIAKKVKTDIMEKLTTAHGVAGKTQSKTNPKPDYLGFEGVMYRFQILDCEGQVIMQSPRIFYNVDECRKIGEKSRIMDQKQSVQIIQEYVKIPNVLVIIKAIIAFLLMENIDNMSTADCYGCQEGYYEDFEHMGGCAMDYKEKIRKYMPEATSRVTVLQTLDIFDQIVKWGYRDCQSINPYIRFAAQLMIECMLSRLSEKFTEEFDIISEDDLEINYGALYHVINGIFYTTAKKE